MTEQATPEPLIVEPPSFNFSVALHRMQEGLKVRRKAEADVVLVIKQATDNKSYIFASKAGGNLVAWAPTQDAILANDWVLV